MLCILCKYIFFSDSDLDCCLYFPRKEEPFFWESVYPPSEELPKAWNPGFSCTIQSEENAIGNYYLGQNWGWATKSEGTLCENGWICLLSHPGLLLALSYRKMLAWISFCFSEGTSPRDTGVAENNCWARTFPTSVWAKYCLPHSHSFASPISLFLTGGNGCLRHGSSSRSLSCKGCQTRKGTPSPTECTQDPWKSALCYMVLLSCPKPPTPREMPLHGLTFFIHIPHTD